MKKMLLAAACVFAGLGSLMLPAQAADTFPTKPIHLVVPSAPGGSIDVVARLVADKMSKFLGQPVLVDSRAGAETLIGTRYVKDQPPDGYTIIIEANGFLTMSALKLDPGYDPLKDFTGIGLIQSSPMIIETGSSQPDKTIKEFMAHAKANPGKLSYASGGVGGPPQVITALFLQKAGLDVRHVLYKGNGAALPDVAGGRVNIITDGYISSAPYFQAKTIIPIAVSGDKRMSNLPEVPTLKEVGVDVDYILWFGLLAPHGTPPAVIQRLSDGLRFATQDKDIIDRFTREGSTTATDTPAQFDAFMKADQEKMMPLILSLNIPKQ